MKKILILFLICILSLVLCACSKTKRNIDNIDPANNEVDILLTMTQKSSAQNQIWVGTFQIVWNDLMDTINNGKPVELLPTMPQSAIELNKKQFSTDYISEDSYYVKHGFLSKELIDTIKRDIKRKFNETSDILKDLAPNNEKFILYAMLKKDFQFIYKFDELNEASFGSNPNKIKYFGINDKSKDNLRKNIRVLNYKDKNNFIIKLLTKSDDEVILYRTDENKTLDKYWEDIQTYTQEDSLNDEDNVKIPYLNFFYKKQFSEFLDKNIKDTEWTIRDAIETVDFKMDETGVKLKSEAAILEDAAYVVSQPRNYYLDDSFTMFLVEKNKKVPYFGARITDVEKLNKR